MADLEKIIKGLEHCISTDKTCSGCPYEGTTCTTTLNADALALLKKQKKATVISIHRNGFGSLVGACPNCQRVLHYEYNQSFCGKCGQELKWE